MNKQILELLDKSKIKATPMRMLVLEQLLIANQHLSLSDIENSLYPSDRVTIYRTLQTFVKFGVVHFVETANKGYMYALCTDNCNKELHFDEHPHFFCEKCKKVICCNDFVVEVRKQNKNSKAFISKIEVTIKGLCDDCN